MTIQQIQNKNIAINCKTEAEAESFLKMAGEDSVEIPSINYWEVFEKDTCYERTNDYLSYGSKKYYTAGGYTIIPFSDMVDGDGVRGEVVSGVKPALKWRKIDPENLPEGEVLAKNESDDQLVGFLEKDTILSKGNILCRCDNTLIVKCTRYITLSDLLGIEME